MLGAMEDAGTAMVAAWDEFWSSIGDAAVPLLRAAEEMGDDHGE